MKFRHLISAFGAALVTLSLATGAFAQAGAPRQIGLGETLRGELSSADRKQADGTPYDAYLFSGKGGTRVTIRMKSADFDAYLVLRRQGATAELATDDDSAGGRDAEISFVLPTTGVYEIRANSTSRESRGAYSIELDDKGAAATAGGGSDLRFGDTVNGELTATSPKHSDGTPYQGYTFRGRAGQTIIVEMKATAFDAYLVLRRVGGSSDIETDDDGGGGTNARLEYRLTQDGDYEIRANSIEADSRGAFTLSLRESGRSSTPTRPSGPAPARVTPAPTPLTLGQTASGELTATSPLHDDGTPYMPYSFQGRAGQRILITMSSSAFDSYLVLRRPGRNDDLETNDDGGGGQNARLEFTLPENGVYEIRANSISADSEGAFTITVREAAPPKTISFGQTVTGTLTADSPLHTDDTPYVPFNFNGQQGQKVVIDMRSTAFDAYLVLRRAGSSTDLSTDDDGGEGTNARLTFTLPATGAYEIRANSVDEDSRGDFTVSLNEARTTLSARTVPGAPAP